MEWNNIKIKVVQNNQKHFSVQNILKSNFFLFPNFGSHSGKLFLKLGLVIGLGVQKSEVAQIHPKHIST